MNAQIRYGKHLSASGRCAGLTLAFLALGCHTAPVLMPRAEVRPPAYSSREAISGRLDLGADADSAALVDVWSLAFGKIHLDMALGLARPDGRAEGRTFLDGEVPLMVMGRRLTRDEVERFQKRTGHPPERIVVALEPLAVLVNAQNPITSLRMEQLDALYSSDRRSNLTQPTGLWSDMGLGGNWANRKITVYAPRADSARCAAFREQALLKADIQDTVRRYADADAMQEALVLDPGGIAFGSMRNLSPRVKVLSLVVPSGPVPALPDAASIRAGRYPLVRYLYLYANAAPADPLPTAAAEFVRFCLSKEGQNLLPALGLVPIPADVAKAGLSRVTPL